MSTVQRLCERVFLFAAGALERDGSPGEVISRYVSSGQIAGPVRTWTPNDSTNRNERVKLLGARVLEVDGQVSGEIPITRPFVVEIEYDSRMTDVRPTAILQFFNDQGICLFATNEFNSPDWLSKSLTPGLVRARCCIPGNLFAEGVFHVVVAVGSYNPNVIYCLEQDALSFQVKDDSVGEGVRGGHAGEWPGVMRPMLRWEIHAP